MNVYRIVDVQETFFLYAHYVYKLDTPVLCSVRYSYFLYFSISLLFNYVWIFLLRISGGIYSGIFQTRVFMSIYQTEI